MYKVYPLPVQDVQFGVHHMLTYGPSASPGRIYGPLNMSELISMRAGGMASGRAGGCAGEGSGVCTRRIDTPGCLREGRLHAYTGHVIRIHIPRTGVCGRVYPWPSESVRLAESGESSDDEIMR